MRKDPKLIGAADRVDKAVDWLLRLKREGRTMIGIETVIKFLRGMDDRDAARPGGLKGKR